MKPGRPQVVDPAAALRRAPDHGAIHMTAAARLALSALLLATLAACATGGGGGGVVGDTPVGQDLPEDANAGENEDEENG